MSARERSTQDRVIAGLMSAARKIPIRSGPPDPAFVRYQQDRADTNSTLRKRAAELFAEIEREYGAMEAKAIFQDVSRLPVGKRKRETDRPLDVALFTHAFMGRSPKRTAELAISLGLKSSPEALEKRIQRLLRASDKATRQAETDK